ncbi:carbamoyl phosphate synthase small subunit, partial [Novosphingobium sp. 1949]
MADAAYTPAPKPEGATGVLVLSTGQVLWGRGFGAVGDAVGEVCFNTSMTGYQEVMTDPSYSGQIVTFTFPHIGNVGVNEEDLESKVDGAVGCVVREDVTLSSNFRSSEEFGDWLAEKGKIGLSGIDTRALTRMIRKAGAPNAVIAHDPEGDLDVAALLKKAQEWPGLEGMDLAKLVTRTADEEWAGSVWALGQGYGAGEGDARPHVVAIDYGAKDNIFRNLVKAGARVTVVPAETSLEKILELKPAGVFLSNGPGDPAATGVYAVPVIKALLEADMPIFGICLGH